MCFERYFSLNIVVTKTIHRRRVESSFFHSIYEMVSVDVVLPRDTIEEMIHCRFQFLEVRRSRCGRIFDRKDEALTTFICYISCLHSFPKLPITKRGRV